MAHRTFVVWDEPMADEAASARTMVQLRVCGCALRACRAGYRALSRPWPRAFHSSSPLRLHAASLAKLPRVSCYAQGLLLAERSRPCDARGHSRRAPRDSAHPKRRRTAPPPVGGAVLPALTRTGSRTGRLRGASWGEASRLGGPTREGAGVRGGRRPEMAAPQAARSRVSPPAADARDRTPRERSRASNADANRPRDAEASRGRSRTTGLPDYRTPELTSTP